MSVMLKAENISKQYRLGTVGTGTLSHDLNRWWHTFRGKEDPYLQVGGVNDRSAKATEDYIWALRDINFEVQQGEVLGIIGKNGAGKSTLLKLLSRVTAPTTGSIKTRGRIASLLEIGTGFHPELTGRENIFMNGAVLGMTKAEIKAKLDEIIAFSGCEMYIDTPVKRYSSGMKVRLGFAVAAHLEPEILVVDEVLAVGDAEFQKKAIGKMQDLSTGEGRTVLFVSHNMASIKNLCSRVIVLQDGCKIFDNGADEAVSFYLGMNQASYSKIPLNERTDRSGNGKVQIKSVEILNKDYKPVFEVFSGQTAILKIELQQNQPINHQKINFAVNFRDHFNNNILSFITDEMGTDFSPLKYQDHFYLKIPHLNLRGETYSLRILMFEGKTEMENLLDGINDILKVNILQADRWKSGVVNRKDFTAILDAECEFILDNK
jgi:lipopolysaccharide transport system ATP-binding protein